MKDLILVLQKDGKEKNIPINKERLILGRDAECDFVLEGTEFSRKHVEIQYKSEKKKMKFLKKETAYRISMDFLMGNPHKTPIIIPIKANQAIIF